MKRLFYILTTFVALVTFAQAQDEEQTGVPAKMEIITGKVIPVYLQSLVDGKLIFQIYKRPKDIPLGDITKVARFDFLNPFDADGVIQLFNSGEYQAVVDKMMTELKPSVDEYWPFMAVDNNFQPGFSALLESYIELDDLDQAETAASALMQSKNPDIRVQGQSAAIKVALKQGNIEQAEKVLEEVDSTVGKLYLQACIERAKQNPKAAFLLVNQIIAEYPNDLQWMPQSEFLNAHLYMDIGLTNSAINTARQVKNIYGNSSVAVKARKLQAQLEAEKAAAEAAAKAREEEAEKERAAVRARAKARAGIVDEPAEDTDVLEETTDEPSVDEAADVAVEVDTGSDAGVDE